MVRPSHDPDPPTTPKGHKPWRGHWREDPMQWAGGELLRGQERVLVDIYGGSRHGQ